MFVGIEAGLYGSELPRTWHRHDAFQPHLHAIVQGTLLYSNGPLHILVVTTTGTKMLCIS